MILHNAKIWTADPAHPWAEALAIEDKRILAVGSEQEVMRGRRGAAERIDLEGKLVIPGLWDAHIHFYYWSLGLQQVQLAGSTSRDDMLERIAAAAEQSQANAWIRGWGWNETFWEDPSLPTRAQLDEATGLERPSIFWRSDMHSALANTPALRMSGLLEPGVEVDGGVIERDKKGEPTGLLRELAINRVREHIPTPSAEHLDDALLEGTRLLHQMGITGICDQRMKDQEDGPRSLAAMARLNRRGLLRLRVNCNVAAHNLPLLEALGLSAVMGDTHLRLGHVKIFCDGTLGSRTAWMLEPFLPGSFDDHENQGMTLTPPEQIADELRRSVELGFPVSIHAIGDRANRVCLDLFQDLRDSGIEPPVVPHRIEHVQTLSDHDLGRLASLGVTASMQPAHVLDDMDTADAYLGERARLAYRIGSLARQGTLMAFGSDAPVADVNPFYGIHGAVCRQRPERMERGAWHGDECLSMEETLKAYTIGAARAAGWDRLTGSLQPGKRADLVVLDRDLFELAEQGVKGREVADTRVVMTIFDGQIVHRLG